MQDFKKAIINSLSFLLVLVVLIVSLINPLMSQPFMKYCDLEQRKNLAPNLDTLFVGASHGECAINPIVFDKIMGTDSYNLSNSLLNWYGKETLIVNECKRNKIDTIYLEIAYDSLTRDYFRAEGDIYTIPRLESLRQRISYFLKYIRFSDYLTVLNTYLDSSVEFYVNKIKEMAFKIIGMKTEGFYPDYHNIRGFIDDDTQILASDGSISEKPTSNDMVIDSDFNAKSLNKLSEIIDYCNQSNIKVVLVVVPVSDALIFSVSNWSDFETNLKKYAEQKGCTLFDFNLIKDRYTILNDGQSFRDIGHMTVNGANSFTKVFAQTMVKNNKGEDISDLFYSSYEEMKADSPYWAYMN